MIKILRKTGENHRRRDLCLDVGAGCCYILCDGCVSDPAGVLRHRKAHGYAGYHVFIPVSGCGSSLIIMMTSFTRIVIVLSFLRNAWAQLVAAQPDSGRGLPCF